MTHPAHGDGKASVASEQRYIYSIRGSQTKEKKKIELTKKITIYRWGNKKGERDFSCVIMDTRVKCRDSLE